MMNLQDYAKQVWGTATVAGKKEVLNFMIDNFEFKRKEALFRRDVAAANSAVKLDKLAADLTLVGDGLKVIK